jgi:hypothetical protein
MIPRPRFRLPLWGAVAAVLVAYLVRSGTRGFDFSLDLPSDAVVILALLVVLPIVGWLRADDARRDAAAGSPADETTDPES